MNVSGSPPQNSGRTAVESRETSTHQRRDHDLNRDGGQEGQRPNGLESAHAI